jgi:hypothetical protein
MTRRDRDATRTKADDSTTDWVWLREALALVVAALGSVALAKERLREWLAAGEVPWSCMWWKGLNAEDLAELKQERDGFFFRNSPLFASAFAPSAAYCPGDPEFWNAGLKIDWEDDGAYELARLDGAQALGIKVSLGHLQALLPPRDAAVPAPSADASEASPAPPKMVSKAALRDAVRLIVEKHPPGTMPPDEESLHRQVETQLEVQVSRERVQAARDDVAPHFKRRVGRPRKSEQ